MGNRESFGIVTILAGVLIVIGAVRGTWGKLFHDVVIGPSDSSSSGSSGSNKPSSGGSVNPLCGVNPLFCVLPFGFQTTNTAPLNMGQNSNGTMPFAVPNGTAGSA